MATTPSQLHLTIYQGATFTRVLSLKDAVGASINLTGATVRMQIRETMESTTVLIELNAQNQRALVTSPSSGEITLSISAADTAALSFVAGVYDLEITYQDGTVDRLLYGKVVLSPEVTR